MDYETMVDIKATPHDVWTVLVDVERWPEWTASVVRAERLDNGPLAVSSRVRIKQPRFPAMVWQVTELEPDRSFSWTARSGGVTTVGDHWLTPRADGTVTAGSSVRQAGTLTALVDLFTAARARSYVDMEAQGLRRRCEAA
jgi:uncharacterized protein YndB with AHSA1/START domain